MKLSLKGGLDTVSALFVEQHSRVISHRGYLRLETRLREEMTKCSRVTTPSLRRITELERRFGKN